MEFTTEDMLKKAVLDCRELVRDYTVYSQKVDDKKVSDCFKKFAETEGKQANRFAELLEEYTTN